MGQRGTDPPSGHPPLGLGGKSATDGDSASYPRRPSAEASGHGTLGESVILDHGKHDPRLVEDRQGARRGVGHEHEALVLDRRRGGLHYDGDLLVAVVPPRAKALEAIEHLVGPVVAGGHA